MSFLATHFIGVITIQKELCLRHMGVLDSDLIPDCLPCTTIANLTATVSLNSPATMK